MHTPLPPAFRALLFGQTLGLAVCAGPLGVFEGQKDIGAVALPGETRYEAATQSYTLRASGTNMWFAQDEFHFVWKKIKGDFLLQARGEFLGEGVDPHRKLGLMVRASLETDAEHVNVSRHGDGLTCLQFRATKGGLTEEKRSPVQAPDVLQLARKAGVYTLSVARHGEPYASETVSLPDLGDEVYLGLFVCSHNNQVLESARFHNVRLIRPAAEGFVPYRDYLGSHLEVLDTHTGERRLLHWVEDSLQAPNWTPEGAALVLNRNGRLYRFDFEAPGTLTEIPTGAQISNNNDHCLSKDGRWLGLSSGQPSRVYVVPLEGGEPRLVTPLGPSYLHGFSPDGKSLVYTAERAGDYDIYRCAVEGGPETRLTEAEGLDDGSEYSPCGNYLYFNSVRSGRMQIWRMRTDGTEQTQVTFDAYNNWFPHPSPDGKTLVFLSYSAEINPGDHPFYKEVLLRSLPIAGGEAKVLAYVYGGQGSINVNSWSPDSRWLAFISNSDTFPVLKYSPP